MAFFLVIFLITAPVLEEPRSADQSGLSEELERIFEIGTVKSLMIQKEDELLYQEFVGDMSPNSTTNIKSASKSILSLLTGIAIDEGYLEGVDQTIGEFFPDYFRENPDSAKESITIENLLTMRSGLETTSFYNYGRWVLSDNWVEFALDQPFEEEPGGRMVYSTGTSHLLSVILTKATGISTRAFAEKHLFGPMDIRVGGWDRDPQGYYMGGNNLAISPVALLRIGEMVLNGGVHNGKQIVPAEWIEDATTIYTRSVYNDYDYGYMWWQKRVGGHDVIFAWGNGGQYIMIIPEFDAVVSITSDLQRSSGSRDYQRRIFTFLEKEIYPFLQNS